MFQVIDGKHYCSEYISDTEIAIVISGVDKRIKYGEELCLVEPGDTIVLGRYLGFCAWDKYLIMGYKVDRDFKLEAVFRYEDNMPIFNSSFLKLQNIICRVKAKLSNFIKDQGNDNIYLKLNNSAPCKLRVGSLPPKLYNIIRKERKTVDKSEEVELKFFFYFLEINGEEVPYRDIRIGELIYLREEIEMSKLEDLVVENYSIEWYMEKVMGVKLVKNKCCCPFHKEKTPSFSVKGNIWTCFGKCKMSGNIIRLHAKNLEIPEDRALKDFINRYGESKGISYERNIDLVKLLKSKPERKVDDKRMKKIKAKTLAVQVEEKINKSSITNKSEYYARLDSLSVDGLTETEKVGELNKMNKELIEVSVNNGRN